jgi:hypothetical protein
VSVVRVTTHGSSAPVAYFSEALEDNTALRLAAAVVCRGVPTPAGLSGGGGLLGWLRAIRHRLWLRLGPLGVDASVAGRSLFGGDAWAPRRISSVQLTHHDAALGYFDAGNRVLRMLGRVFTVPPPGQTLVALVDATGRRANTPGIVLRIVPTPTVAIDRPELPAPSPDVAVSVVYTGSYPVWETALRADPVVRAFVDRDDN